MSTEKMSGSQVGRGKCHVGLGKKLGYWRGAYAAGWGSKIKID
jgi:hypothetical protein